MSNHDEGHNPNLAHHFESMEQQFQAGKTGMWLFLVTEILLFGGLFSAYAVYRANHPEIFQYGHQFLSVKWGGINTVVLICSSLTMAWGVRAAMLGQKTLLTAMLVVTLLCACGFLAIKYVEYEEKWRHGLLPGKHFAYEAHHGDDHSAESESEEAAATTPTLTMAAPAGQTMDRSLIPPPAEPPMGLARAVEEGGHHAQQAPHNLRNFFTVYFLLTGLHGLHVLAGMGAIGYYLFRHLKKPFGPENFAAIDLVGLYWHLVDLIWIYLFPLLYLIH